MKKIIDWIDGNLLSVLAGFLLVFIPLYPKWPLFDVIPGYIVRARLEDILVALTLIFFVLQVVRRKVHVTRNLPTMGILAYLVFGFASMLVAVFVLNTVPLEFVHAGKTFLHWLRRIEYFSLFFIFFMSLNSLKKVKVYLVLFFLTFLGVILYGYGQKYLYWPAFSTMNREFSKGWRLYLTEGARVLSTFGGHYDLAGYLVIALSLTWSFIFGLKNRLAKTALMLLAGLGFWLLVLTASRISFLSYLLGFSVVVFFWMFKRGIGWAASRWVAVVLLSVVFMLIFGEGLSDRFLRLARISERFSGISNILLKPMVTAPKDKAVFLENNLAAVTNKLDQPPVPYPPGKKPQPADVTGKEEPLLMPVKTASGSTILVERKRTYSRNALLFDLSTSIRLDATWPRAIERFLADPLLGSGYATLTKTHIEEFTEAESTDNDYLRALGETGLLGFLTFFGTIITLLWIAFRALPGIKDKFFYSLVVGYLGLTVGLLFNALLIDIFEASKVAYVFWAISGLTFGTIFLLRQRIKEDWQPLKLHFERPNLREILRKIMAHDRYFLLILLIAAFYLRTYKLDSPIADWHSWRQADTSAVSRNFIKNEQINWFYPTYDDLSSVASGKPNPRGLRYVEFPIYNALTVGLKKVIPELSIEASGRVVSAVASLYSICFIFLICRTLFSRRIAYFAAGAFAMLPYSVYYSRTILPESTMVAFALGAVWLQLKYLRSKKIFYFLLSIILAGLAFLVKPFAIFLIAPVVYFWWAERKLFTRRIVMLVIYSVAAVIPFFLWRLWIAHFPEGIPASDWLFNGDNIRFKGAFWYWLFADRMGRLILGYWGLVPLAFGLVRKPENKYFLFPVLFFASALLYLAVFATGNVRHDYYQILLIPSLSILIGIGLDYLLFTNNSITNNLITKLVAVVSVAFMLGFGWYFVRDYFNINHPEIVRAGQAVEKLTTSKALVIAPYGGDTAFLYQTNRRGWPLVENSLDYLIQQGATHYVTVSYDDLTKKLIAEAKSPTKGYKVLAQEKDYAIIQLVPDAKLPKD